mgnify:FL=1
MSEKIDSVLTFIILNYSKSSISVFRLIRIVFLAEWYSAIIQKETLSSSVWYRRNFGPDSDDVTKSLLNLKDIYLEQNNDDIDGISISVFRTDNLYNYKLSALEKSIVSLAMKHAKEFDFIELDNYIENLFPMKNTAINAKINLKDLAKDAP